MDTSTLSLYFSLVEFLNILCHYLSLQSQAACKQSPDYFPRWYLAILKNLWATRLYPFMSYGKGSHSLCRSTFKQWDGVGKASELCRPLGMSIEHGQVSTWVCMFWYSLKVTKYLLRFETQLAFYYSQTFQSFNSTHLNVFFLLLNIFFTNCLRISKIHTWYFDYVYPTLSLNSS